MSTNNMTLRKILCSLLWNGTCVSLFVLSILSTIDYRHDYDRYRYFYHQYQIYHRQDDYDQILIYYDGYMYYIQYVILDLFLSSLVCMSLLSELLYYIESRIRNDYHYPPAYTNSAV